MGLEAKITPRKKAMHKSTKPTSWRKTAMDRRSDQWPQTCGVILGKLPGVMEGNELQEDLAIFRLFLHQLNPHTMAAT